MNQSIKQAISGLACVLATQAATANPVAKTDAALFRQIFAATLQAGQTSSVDQLNHLVYAPSDVMFDEAKFVKERCDLPVNLKADANRMAENVARGALCKMGEVYKGLSAGDLYNNGVALGSQPSAIDLVELSKNLQEKDLLIVVVPGIFGEFIQKRAFEEVFPVVDESGKIQNDSSFAKDFRRSFTSRVNEEMQGKTCSEMPLDASVCDEQEQLSRLTLEKDNRGQKNLPISELLNVGSVDDADGNPLAKVVLFQMDAMTLESLGLQEKNAQIFTRRLEKFFKIMGHTPKNIAFVGYSRGTDFALEMLSQAKGQNKPWLASVRGLVSLGGVVFGSALADEAITNPNSKIHNQLHLLDVLSSSLTPVPNLEKVPYSPENAKWLAYNTLAWWKFIVAMAKIQNDGKPLTTINSPVLTAEMVRQQTEAVITWLKTQINNRGAADPAFGLQLVIAQSLKFGLVSATNIDTEMSELSLALQGLLSGNPAGITRFIANHLPNSTSVGENPYTVKYNTDIRRFKKLATAVKNGATELTTDSRLSWWRTHEIPLSLRYYSVSATMADPETDLGKNRFAYNPGSPDDNSLVQNWLDFQKVSISPEYVGVSLNDSQVAIYKTTFWPTLIQSLNPANSGVRSTPLGILGTHHWGLALPIVVQVKRIGPDNGQGLMEKNPFPRPVLMESIALSIANDIRNDEQNVKGQ